jgi:hypothetical protein
MGHAVYRARIDRDVRQIVAVGAEFTGMIEYGHGGVTTVVGGAVVHAPK